LLSIHTLCLLFLCAPQLSDCTQTNSSRFKRKRSWTLWIFVHVASDPMTPNYPKLPQTSASRYSGEMKGRWEKRTHVTSSSSSSDAAGSVFSRRQTNTRRTSAPFLGNMSNTEPADKPVTFDLWPVLTDRGRTVKLLLLLLLLLLWLIVHLLDLMVKHVLDRTTSLKGC